MRFADIAGHEETKARLREMADSGRIPHALLLEGPSGAGKFLLARALRNISTAKTDTTAIVAVSVPRACSTRRSTISTPFFHSR